MAKPQNENASAGATGRLTLTAALDALPVAVRIIDGAGAVVGANARMAALAGSAGGRGRLLAGEPLSRFLPEGHRSVMDIMRSGEGSYGFRLPELEGVRLVAIPLGDEGKGLAITAADPRDLGPFFGSSQDARATNRLYDKAAVAYPDGLIVLDSRGAIVKANAAAASLAGVEPVRLEGRPVSYLAGGVMEDGGLVLEVLSRGRRAAGLARFPVTGRSAFVAGYPVSGPGGTLTLAAFSLRDLASRSFGEAADTAERELFAAFRDEVAGKQPRGAAPASPFSKESNAMQRALERATRLARTGVSEMLVSGEPGSGKRALARFVHECPSRPGGNFAIVRCAGRDAASVEADLFGSGAGSARIAGLLEAAGRGTVYLEDADALPLPLQERLLSLFRARSDPRIRESLPSAAVILSSAADIESLLERRLFSAELHEHLDPRSVTVPPLRSRREDIAEIARQEVSEVNLRYGLARFVDPHAAELLAGHAFPGNVRELRSVVHQAALFSHSPNIGPFLARLFRPAGAASARSARPGALLGDDDRLPDFQTVKLHGLSAVLDEIERRVLEEAIENCRSTREMATRLGISQAGVSRKLKKFSLEAPGKSPREY
jgi:DNA-binding NtrC family response regulator/PAS domain-containing protein